MHQYYNLFLNNIIHQFTDNKHIKLKKKFKTSHKNEDHQEYAFCDINRLPNHRHR